MVPRGGSSTRSSSRSCRPGRRCCGPHGPRRAEQRERRRSGRAVVHAGLGLALRQALHGDGDDRSGAPGCRRPRRARGDAVTCRGPMVLHPLRRPRLASAPPVCTGEPGGCAREVGPALRQAVGSVPRRRAASGALQLDTYEREVERYGGADGIELAERRVPRGQRGGARDRGAHRPTTRGSISDGGSPSGEWTGCSATSPSRSTPSSRSWNPRAGVRRRVRGRRRLQGAVGSGFARSAGTEALLDRPHDAASPPLAPGLRGAGQPLGRLRQWPQS